MDEWEQYKESLDNAFDNAFEFKDIFYAIVFLFFVIGFILLYLLIRYWSPLREFLYTYTRTGQIGLFITGLFIVAGLFWLRENRRLMYGLIELAFGIVSIWFTLGDLLANSQKWANFVGAVYVSIRGSDNIKEGFKRYKETRPLPPYEPQ